MSYNHYGLRHPGGIFNIQFAIVARDMLDTISKLNTTSNPTNAEALLGSFRGLLASLSTFLESPYEMMLAFCPSMPTPKGKRPIHEWLKSNGFKVGEKFFHEMQPEVRFFRELNNRLKHTSNTIRSCAATAAQFSIVGYYLESAHIDGSIGPDDEFYTKYSDHRVTNSFNRDLRRIYYCLYKTASVLSKCLAEHYKEVWGRPLDFDGSRREDDTLYRRLLREVSGLAAVFLPSEINLLFPSRVFKISFSISSSGGSLSHRLILFRNLLQQTAFRESFALYKFA